MSCSRSSERRLTVAKDSVVRNPGAFHLISSVIPGAASTRICRTASISGLSGCLSLAVNAST